MQRPGRKCFAAFISAALAYITLGGLIARVTKDSGPGEFVEDRQWIADSKNWLDRQACYWIGFCGVGHVLHPKAWTWPPPDDQESPITVAHTDFWTSGAEDAASWSPQEKELRTIPQYVLDHAPYVHLFSGEDFWPCDIAEHLVHTSPRINYTVIEEMKEDRNLSNLNELDDYEDGRHGKYIYLQSNDNVEERPHWLGGEKNIPSAPEALPIYGDAPWPALSDLGDYDLESAKQQALRASQAGEQVDEAREHEANDPWNTWKSPDGTCGGSTGYTCAGTEFGRCCSIFGYCGKSDAHCGQTCDPLSGKCNSLDVKEKLQHPDLRRRQIKREFRGLQNKPREGGKSSAPAILVVVPKENGIIDAFWFFFYSYNLGNTVFNVRFGNHVGDWEHTVIRFKHGEPKTVFLSEHNFGEAYAWHAIEKYMPNPDGSMISSTTNASVQQHGKRPVVYSAAGSHAMYGTPGLHPYVLPWGLLHDRTDRGPLWDPVLNSHAFVYDLANKTLRASTHTPRAPTHWFFYSGHWGDKFYPLSDPRQYRFAGQYHYVNGPLGPRFKHLARKQVCQSPGECHIRHWLGGGQGATHLPPEEDVEEGGLPGGNLTDSAGV